MRGSFLPRCSTLLLLAAMAISLFLVSGCAKQAGVDLIYRPVALDNAACTGRIALVRFADVRTDPAVAVKDGEKQYATSDVSTWFTNALRQQLTDAGCSVEYHDRRYDFDTDAVISGEIEELMTKPASMTTRETKIRFKVVVSKPGAPDFIRHYSGEFEKPVLLDDASDLLEQALQEMMKDKLPEIIAATK